MSEPAATPGRRVRACALSDLKTGDAVVVALSRLRPRIPREAVVVRDFDGEPRAYLNVCKHLPVPLDSGSGDFFDSGKTALLCGTHGALYELETGYCFDGPCEGTYLDALPIVVEDGVLYVLDATAAAAD